MISVSIHIVTYNSASVISQCIAQLRNQTFKNTQILVIDNASSDKTPSILKKLHVQTVRNKENIGYAQAHNQALHLTNSVYVLTLNPDVFLDKYFLEHMVKNIKSAPDCVGSACGLLLRVNNVSMKSSVVDGAGLYLDATRRQRLRYEGEPQENISKKNEFIFGPDGAAAFYKRKMLEDISLNDECFDSDFFMHKEDVDVAWRAQLYGWKSMCVPSAIGYHIRSFRAGDRKRVSASVKQIAVRNRYLLLLKNETLSHFLKHSFQIISYDVGIFLYVLGFERTSISAYKEVVLLSQKMIKKRHVIMNMYKQRKRSGLL